MKKILSIFTLLAFLFIFASCGNDNESLELLNRGTMSESKFGGIYIDITIDDFNELGFKYGDSIDIYFSNDYEIKDLPYYNGYYTDTGYPLLVAYPGYPYIKACINNGDDLYQIAGLADGDTADIKLSQRGKYLDIQEALDIHYTDIQGDIPDNVFGNFRSVNVGNLKTDILYRSASPVDNQHNRAAVVDRLINNKVNTIINLSDNDSELEEHLNSSDFNSPYAKTLYERNSIIALSMNMNFKSLNNEEDDVPNLFRDFKDAVFTNKLIQGLNFITENDGPYLVHCVEGKDRTGFVCMVIEAIAGASYDEIINDYMITYDNYYGINLNDEPSKYNIIKEKNIEEMLRTIINDDSVDIKTANYGEYCTNYLLSKGMEADKINLLKQKLAQ